jgi:hypothetical protein
MAASASLDPDQITDAQRAVARALRDGDLEAGEAMAGRWPEFLLVWWNAEELDAAWREAREWRERQCGWDTRRPAWSYTDSVMMARRSDREMG